MKKQRFNFDKNYKLYNACATDQFRPAMEMVHFKDGFAYASDSHILVRVPIGSCVTGMDEEEFGKLNGFSIHWKVLKKLYSYDRIFIERDDEAGTCEIHMSLEDHDICVQLRSQETLNVPNFEAVIQKNREGEPVSKLGISPKMLARLGSAINLSDRVCMNISGQKNAIHISDMMSGAVAVIMPLMVNED